ncbi:MAG: hypothetical protein QXK49_03090 [Candidatus Aenigmatarchaeota archaeon]
MEDLVIETQIDKLIEILSKKRKIALSEAARILNIKESQLDTWISTLEDKGIVELKYPVLGEPELVLKGILPEKVSEVKAELKETEKTEKVQEIKKEPDLLERIKNLEKQISEITEEIEVSRLKEEMFEILIIISTLNDIEKIRYYLSFIEKIILALKARNSWGNVDKELMFLTLKSMSESSNKEIGELFEEIAKKIETI